MLREMLRVTFGRASLRRALSMGTKKAGARGKQAAAAVVLGAGAGGGYYIMQQPVLSAEKAEDVDALIIGGGIMGATVAVMLKLLQPTWRVRLVEQHSRVGQEATNEWHNAGTGHAALCEPNYTPANPKTGEVEIDKAVAVNQKFMTSLAFWSWLVEKGILQDGAFIQPAPHILFVHGQKGVDWLRQRVEKLTKLPAFAATVYSEDYDTIKSWVPLLTAGRPKSGEVIACSRHPDGTEVNYGLLCRNLVQSFTELGGEVQLLSTVTGLRQQEDKSWLIAVKRDDLTDTNQTVRARFVFAGAGGGSLRILQKAGIPEIVGYGGMPVSGKFLVCQKPEIIEQNRNKVYGQADVDAPPMSVPHLDWRTIYGKDCIFFGPFAGFSPMIFKMSGSPLDWFATMNPNNLFPMIKMGLQNLDLVKYLVKEVFASKEAQLSQLRKFYPDAKPEDWTMVWAGQRIQIVNPKGQLQFGTEVLSSKDGTIVGLLGASPGASVSPQIAIEVLNKFSTGATQAFDWHVALSSMIPCYGRDINAEPGLYEKIISNARDILLHGKTSGYRAALPNAQHLFDRIDSNGDGVLTLNEVKGYLQKQGMKEKNIKTLIDAIDQNQKAVSLKGHISRADFDKSFPIIAAGMLRRTMSVDDSGWSNTAPPAEGSSQ